ncbi:unnamed protein product [Arabidopsis halleri]
MEYEEDERSECYTSEVDWGEEPNHSWNGEDDYGNSSWRGGADSEISPGEGYERDEGEFWGSLVATTFLRQTTAGDLPQSHQ